MIKVLATIVFLAGYAFPALACSFYLDPDYNFGKWLEEQTTRFERQDSPDTSLRVVYGHFESIGPIQIEDTTQQERQRILARSPNDQLVVNFSARRISALAVFVIVDPRPYSDHIERIEVTLVAHWANLLPLCSPYDTRDDGYKSINFSSFLGENNVIYALEKSADQTYSVSSWRRFIPRQPPNNLQTRWLSQCIFEEVCNPNRAFWIRGWRGR